MPTEFSKEINPPPESNSFSTSSSSSSSQHNNNQQQQKIGKKSIGNQHKFAQQCHSKKFKASDPEDNFGNSDIFINAKVEQVVDKLSSCCANGTRFGFGCLLLYFERTIKGIVSYQKNPFKQNIWIVVNKLYNI
jgi:hypothetical protein